MKKSPLYLHFIPHGFEKTVIDSQVVVPALKLKSEGCVVHLVFLEPFFDWLFHSLPWMGLDLKGRTCGLSYTCLPRFPRNNFGLNTLMMGFYLMVPLIGGRSVVVHARGLQGAAWIVPLKKLFRNLALICDVRGIEWEEYAYTASKAGQVPLNLVQREWRHRLELLASQALKFSDACFCVSKSMMTYLQDWMPKKDPKRWEYVPCAVEVTRFSSALASRDQSRSEFKITDRFVVVYSGAFRDWQMPLETLQCFKLIQELDPTAFFLCLTPDVKEFSNLLDREKIDLNDRLVCRVEHREIEKYLTMGDVGILLREENPLNAYSCPTKFAEYLASGLHVVTTAAIRDVSEVVRKHKIGTILSNLKDKADTSKQIESVLAKSKVTSNRINLSTQCAQSLYDWSRYTPIIKKWYIDLTFNP